MTLSIKNGGYTFLIRLDLMFYLSSWKEIQLLEILNELILQKNDVKMMIPEMNTSIKAMEWFFFCIVNLMLGCLFLKKFKKI